MGKERKQNGWNNSFEEKDIVKSKIENRLE